MDKNDRPRDGNGKFTRTLEGAQRDAEACRLYSRGLTYEQISDELDYGGKQNAYRAVKAALAALPALAAEELRHVQLQELAYLKRKLLEVLETDHLTISQGGKVVHYKRKPVIDQGPIVQAVSAYRQLLEREAKLVGTDAHARREVTVADIDAELARLLAEDDDEFEGDEDCEAEAAS